MMFTQMIKNAPSSAASRSWSVSGQDFYFAHSFAVSDSPESDRPSGGGIAIEKWLTYTHLLQRKSLLPYFPRTQIQSPAATAGSTIKSRKLFHLNFHLHIHFNPSSPLGKMMTFFLRKSFSQRQLLEFYSGIRSRCGFQKTISLNITHWTKWTPGVFFSLLLSDDDFRFNSLFASFLAKLFSHVRFTSCRVKIHSFYCTLARQLSLQQRPTVELFSTPSTC